MNVNYKNLILTAYIGFLPSYDAGPLTSGLAYQLLSSRYQRAGNDQPSDETVSVLVSPRETATSHNSPHTGCK